MIYLAKYILFALALFLLTAAFYIAIMKLRDLRDSGALATLHWSVTLTGRMLLLIGLLLDVALNLLVMTIVFLEIPRELLVTARVKRHKWNGNGWRKRLACWMCANYLTPFDARHCG